MARKLIQKYHKWGLKVNMNKSKYMATGDLHQDLILEEDMERFHIPVSYTHLNVSV